MIRKALAAGLLALALPSLAGQEAPAIDWREGRYRVDDRLWIWKGPFPLPVRLRGHLVAGEIEASASAFGARRYEITGRYDPALSQVRIACAGEESLYLIDGPFDGREARLRGLHVGGAHDGEGALYEVRVGETSACGEGCLEILLALRPEEGRAREARFRLFEE